MSTWNSAALAEIRPADDLHIAPLREDGKTYGTLTWIWSVVVDDNLYVRAYHGRQSRWYQAAMARPAGRIRVAGTTRAVEFHPVSSAELNERIDAAYRTKYAGSPYLGSMISERARAATVQITPSDNA